MPLRPGSFLNIMAVDDTKTMEHDDLQKRQEERISPSCSNALYPINSLGNLLARTVTPTRWRHPDAVLGVAYTETIATPCEVAWNSTSRQANQVADTR